MQTKNIKMTLILLFTIVSIITYLIQNKSKDKSIDIILQNDISNLKLHYNYILEHFEEIANTASKDIQSNNKVVNIIKKSNTASWFKKKELRDQLYKETNKLYRNLRHKKSITSLHFVLPNNKSFLRVHKKIKHSDDLSNISEIFKYVNNIHQPINGFEVGRIKNSFNYVYPLYDENKNYIGSFSLGFDSKYFQDILTEKLNTFSHFLIKKELFESVTYKNNGYKISPENDKYMYIPNHIVNNNGDIEDKKFYIEKIKENIINSMSKNDQFAYDFIQDSNSFSVVFLPIKSFDNKNTIAYLASYIKKDDITNIYYNFRFNMVISIILILIIFLFIYNTLIQKQRLKEEVKRQTQEIEKQKESLAFINTDLESQVITRIGEIYALNEEIKETQREVVYTMGTIAESRSKETANHVKRVAEYSKIFAIHYGLGSEKAEMLKEASPMHDIGKVAIADSILKKDGKLTSDEREKMKSHTVLGYDLLKHSNRELLQTAATISLEHHEKWDGTGYPKGLKGEEINIYGRITAVADVFDALGSKRVYKDAWSDEDIFEMFRNESGKHFDPKLIDIFFENLEEFLEVRERLKDTI